MTSAGPAFQECTGSFHENVPALKVVSPHLRSTDGLTVCIGQDTDSRHLGTQTTLNTHNETQ